MLMLPRLLFTAILIFAPVICLFTSLAWGAENQGNGTCAALSSDKKIVYLKDYDQQRARLQRRIANQRRSSDPRGVRVDLKSKTEARTDAELIDALSVPPPEMTLDELQEQLNLQTLSGLSAVGGALVTSAHIDNLSRAMFRPYGGSEMTRLRNAGLVGFGIVLTKQEFLRLTTVGMLPSFGDIKIITRRQFQSTASRLVTDDSVLVMLDPVVLLRELGNRVDYDQLKELIAAINSDKRQWEDVTLPLSSVDPVNPDPVMLWKWGLRGVVSRKFNLGMFSDSEIAMLRSQLPGPVESWITFTIPTTDTTPKPVSPISLNSRLGIWSRIAIIDPPSETEARADFGYIDHKELYGSNYGGFWVPYIGSKIKFYLGLPEDRTVTGTLRGFNGQYFVMMNDVGRVELIHEAAIDRLELVEYIPNRPRNGTVNVPRALLNSGSLRTLFTQYGRKGIPTTISVNPSTPGSR